MDPLAPAQVIAWIVTGFLALFSLGGCLRTNGYAEPVYYQAPFYGAPPAAPAQPANFQPRGIAYCFRSGNAVICS